MKNNSIEEKLSIVIICYKHDYFFTKVCVASIRYYYPNIEIFLVKDLIAGKFSTKKLETSFNVKKLDLGKQKYGWTSAKVFFLLSTKMRKKKYLVLDSDIVFVGPVLLKLRKKLNEADFIVSPEYHNKPGGKSFNFLYYDLKWAKKKFLNFDYPGFAFNTGATVVTPGLIKIKNLLPYFLPTKYPFWNPKFKQRLCSKDQSLLNIIFPYYDKQKNIKLRLASFMWWSESKIVRKKITLNEVKKGKNPYLIHWAGYNKDVGLLNLTRSDILSFFLKHYYSKLSFGLMRYYLTIIRMKFFSK
jgi:hypothetical protein